VDTKRGAFLMDRGCLVKIFLLSPAPRSTEFKVVLNPHTHLNIEQIFVLHRRLHAHTTMAEHNCQNITRDSQVLVFDPDEKSLVLVYGGVRGNKPPCGLWHHALPYVQSY